MILVKEKGDLDKVIQKLATLHKAFEILAELTSGNKKQYELLKNKIYGLEKMCDHLAQSKLLAMTIKQPFFLVHVRQGHKERQIEQIGQVIWHFSREILIRSIVDSARQSVF